MVSSRGCLKPVDYDGVEVFKKIGEGATCIVEIKGMRNIRFHKKLFALLNLAFEYWIPDCLISDSEIAAARRFGRVLERGGLSHDAVSVLVDEFIKETTLAREHIVVDKSFEAFRMWITVQAGFYDLVASPDGPRKVARSISFAKMDEIAFKELYKSVFDVAWNLCLKTAFDREGDAEEAINKLMGMR